MASVPLAQLMQCLVPYFSAIGFLEAVDVLAADEGRLADDGLDGGIDLGLDGLVLGFEVDKGHVHDDVMTPFQFDGVPYSDICPLFLISALG